jgi:hypothetical protein
VSTGKASGLDALPNEIIKVLRYIAHGPIFTLFKAMAKHSYTFKKWCPIATILICKPNKAELHNPANYRPITLMNCILKLRTILATIGIDSTKSEGVHSDVADGFRTHRNTYDSLSTKITM